jgi:hypothetical protein
LGVAIRLSAAPSSLAARSRSLARLGERRLGLRLRDALAVLAAARVAVADRRELKLARGGDTLSC